MTLSLVVPVYREESHVLEIIFENARRSGASEVLLVEACEGDSDTKLFSEFNNLKKFDRSPCAFNYLRLFDKGRALQMNYGAEKSIGDILLFVHADTKLPKNAGSLIQHALKDRAWGRFNVCLDETGWRYRLLAWLMNKRSGLTGIVTGDQAMFITKALFFLIRGYPAIDLMEDIAISKKLKKNPFACTCSRLCVDVR